MLMSEPKAQLLEQAWERVERNNTSQKYTSPSVSVEWIDTWKGLKKPQQARPVKKGLLFFHRG